MPPGGSTANRPAALCFDLTKSRVSADATVTAATPAVVLIVVACVPVTGGYLRSKGAGPAT
jgi:hypothetical protein